MPMSTGPANPAAEGRLVPWPSPDIAAAVAGALAESGVLALIVGPPAPASGAFAEADVELHARTTDLPGVLLGLPPGSTLRAADGSIRLDLQPNEVRWRCARPDLAAALRLLGPPARP